MSDLPAAPEAAQLELLPSEWPSSWPAWVREVVAKMDVAERQMYDWIPVQSREWVASMGVQIIRSAYPRRALRQMGWRLSGQVPEQTGAGGLPQGQAALGGVRQRNLATGEGHHGPQLVGR